MTTYEPIEYWYPHVAKHRRTPVTFWQKLCVWIPLHGKGNRRAC